MLSNRYFTCIVEGTYATLATWQHFGREITALGSQEYCSTTLRILLSSIKNSDWPIREQVPLAD